MVILCSGGGTVSQVRDHYINLLFKVSSISLGGMGGGGNATLTAFFFSFFDATKGQNLEKQVEIISSQLSCLL